MTDLIKELEEAERGVPLEVRETLMTCALQNGRISYQWLLNLYKHGKRDGASAAEGVISMVIHRIGGIVEGRPTERVNFLQRIDELVSKEAQLLEQSEEVADAMALDNILLPRACKVCGARWSCEHDETAK